MSNLQVYDIGERVCVRDGTFWRGANTAIIVIKAPVTWTTESGELIHGWRVQWHGSQGTTDVCEEDIVPFN